MEDALNWIKYTGDVTILPKLGSVDSGWPMLSIFFTECKYKCFKCSVLFKEYLGRCDVFIDTQFILGMISSVFLLV